MYVVGVKTDAPFKLSGLDCRKCGHDAVHVWLGADEAGMDVVLRLPDQMLACAEADFEPDFVNRSGEERSQPALGWRLA